MPFLQFNSPLLLFVKLHFIIAGLLTRLFSQSNIQIFCLLALSVSIVLHSLSCKNCWQITLFIAVKMPWFYVLYSVLHYPYYYYYEWPPLLVLNGPVLHKMCGSALYKLSGGLKECVWSNLVKAYIVVARPLVWFASRFILLLSYLLSFFLWCLLFWNASHLNLSRISNMLQTDLYICQTWYALGNASIDLQNLYRREMSDNIENNY